MGLLGKIKRATNKLSYRYSYRELTPLRLEKPIFSVTFDDVPISTLHNGVPIMKELGVHGTFYIASRLASGDWIPDEVSGRVGECIPLEALPSLVADGHHVACHTYTHYNLDNGRAEELYWDTLMNRQSLANVLGKDIEHFSFPFGKVNLRAKKYLRNAYKTIRTITRGSNVGAIDLKALRTVSIYSPMTNKDEIKNIIADTVAKRGWLILYTHGVTDTPSRFDTTPDDFRWALEQCLAASGDFLTVEKAYEKITKA